jgi:fatty-acyl-CoA synthase
VVSLKGWIVHCGVPGELCMRGYLVMAGGYWQQPDKTVEAVDSLGWMHSGDLAVIDEAGFANIVGRIKELIIRGGGEWALAIGIHNQSTLRGPGSCMNGEAVRPLLSSCARVWTAENIMPREVEDAATECDFVKACAVVGVPNPLWGEEVFAWVVLKSNFQESAALTASLTSHLESRIADFKVSLSSRASVT